MGYLLREQLEWLIGCVERVGATVLQAGLLALVVHVCFKLSMRWLFVLCSTAWTAGARPAMKWFLT